MTKINAVARSYIEEALATYRGQCWKATAVMVGAATESVVLDVRNAITTQLDTPGVTLAITRKERERLDHWAIKGILDQLKAILDGVKMPHDLQEEYSGYWGSIAHHARFARNDAGHPSSLNPVRAETVHAALLLFPTHAELAERLINWIPTGIT